MPNDIPIKNPRNKKVLITGGTGFLGSRLALALKKSSFDVHIYEGDVRNLGAFKIKYGIVCHLAAINKIGGSVSEKMLFEVNVGGTSAVMRYCAKNDSRCIFASSAAVYRPSKRDELLSEVSLIGPTTLYGASKMLAENICKDYARREGLSVTILRVFNVYGPRQNKDFLIPYILSRLVDDKTVVLKTPYAVRDFIHVQDAARAFVTACVKGKNGLSIFNVGTGRGMSAQKIAGLLGDIMDVEPKIALKKDCARKRDFVIAGISHIREDMGWKTKIPVEAGLRHVAQKARGFK